MKYRFFIVLAVAALLLAACQSVAGTPVTTTAPDVAKTEPVAQVTGESAQEEPAQTEEPAQPPAPTATATDAPTPTATAEPAPYPIMGGGQPLTGLFAAIVDGFQPGEDVTATLYANGDTQVSERTLKADPQGRAMPVGWVLDGVDGSLEPGAYTYVLAGESYSTTLQFEVGQPPAFKMPDAVECRVVPDDLHLHGNAIIWCWGTPIDGRTTFRFSAGGVDSDVTVISTNHVAVFPGVLDPDGQPAGEWVLTVYDADGQQLAQYTLEVSE